MSIILSQICKDTEEVVKIQKRSNWKRFTNNIDNSDKPRAFKDKIDSNYKNKKLSLIAEIKKASPSKGIISKTLIRFHS